MDRTHKECSFDGFMDWSQMEGLADGLDSERRFDVRFSLAFFLDRYTVLCEEMIYYCNCRTEKRFEREERAAEG
jgi:hypothetical protein